MTEPNIIQAGTPTPVVVRTTRHVLPYGAPLDSAKENTFKENVLSDLIALAQLGNVTARSILNAWHTLHREKEQAIQGVAALRRQVALDRKIRALQGHRIAHSVDLHDGSKISFLAGADISKRAAVSTLYGQATVPMNGVESRLYSLRLLSEGTVVPSTLDVSVTGIFDKQDGDGAVDYEYGGTVEELRPKNVANGDNLEYWRRRVIFPLESDVSEVECEVTITVPPAANLYANVAYAHPYPLGTVDLTGLWVASDMSGAFSVLPSFEEILGAGRSRWFFPSQKVAQVRARLRQRNWHEENGRKVFEYGMQELGLQLVEWDQHWDSDYDSLTDNHSFVVRIDAEEGFRFHRLYGLYTTPEWTDEPADNRHIHIVLATDAAGANVVWSSDTDGAPQDAANPTDLGGVTTLYAIVTLNWVEVAGSGSPFQAGTTPWIGGLDLDATYVRSS